MKKKPLSKNGIGIFLLFMVYAIRIFNLDSDMPNWGVGEYTPLDEGYYAMQAYQNVNHNGLQGAADLLTGQYRLWNSSLSLFNTIFCTFSMKLFGNNYYGLRMSSVFAGAIVLFIIILLMFYNNEKTDFWPAMLLGVFIVFNFSFKIATRIVEPGVYRMLILCCMILFFYKTYKKEALCYTGMGVFALWSLIFGYITNVFVAVPLGILLFCHILWKHKLPLQKIGYLAAGGIGGYLSGELLYYLFQGRWFAQDMIRVVLGREIRRAGFSPEYLVWNLKAVLQGNMFGYNAAFLILSVLAVLYCVYVGYRDKDECLLYISWLCIGFLTQSMFTSDFLIRKSITIFPVLIVTIYYLLRDIHAIVSNNKIKYGTIGLLLAVAFCAVVLSLKRIMDVGDADMISIAKKIMIVLNIMSVCGTVIFVLLLQKKKSHMIYAGLLISLVLPNLYMNYAYIYSAEKTEKEAMIDMKELGNSYALGDAYSYCLYNDVIPVSSCYDNYFPEDYKARAKELLKREDVNYYIGYRDMEMITEWLSGTPYKWELVKKYDTAYQVSWQDEDQNGIYIFKKVLK